MRDQSAAYRRQRITILDGEPLCRYCRARGHVTAATIVDHVIALCLGGSNDPANLAPACRACNDAKAVIEARCVARGYDLASVRHDPELSDWITVGLLISYRAQP